ncbi:MAG: DMT family transporter [Leptothrix sp. (in: b-proteobacteria)]
MTGAQRTPWLAYACLAGSMALVGSYVGLSRLLVGVFPIFLLAWLRFGIAAIAMAGWLRKPADEPVLSRHDRVLLFFESFLGNFLFSICMLYGVALSNALTAGVVMAALPGVVALLSRLFLRERLTRPVLAGIACAVGGIALVNLSKPSVAEAAVNAATHAAGQGSTWFGTVLLIAAVLCEASYVVIGKRLSGQLGAKRISAIVNLWGLALVTPLGLWQALRYDFDTPSAGIWVLLLFYALAASVVTIWLWMTGLRHVPAAQAGVFSVMLPLSAAAVGIGVLGEPFSRAQAAAFALALLRAARATWPSRQAPR